jgi:hypothetical protein
MGQRENTNDAALKDAPVWLSREECASSMVQRSNDAAAKDAGTKLLEEEFALGMEQKSNGAAAKDAQIIPNEEEYVGDTVHTATITMNLQLWHRVLDQTLIRLL